MYYESWWLSISGDTLGSMCAVTWEKNILWYFDSFDMQYPKEYEFRAKQDGMKVIYNTVPYQHIKSVLGAYYYLFLTQTVIWRGLLWHSTNVQYQWCQLQWAVYRTIFQINIIHIYRMPEKFCVYCQEVTPHYVNKYGCLSAVTMSLWAVKVSMNQIAQVETPLMCLVVIRQQHETSGWSETYFITPHSVKNIKPPANGRNIVGCYMLRPFAHPVAYCWMLLRLVAESLKPVKLFSQQDSQHFFCSVIAEA